jgi:hypothetical protein
MLAARAVDSEVVATMQQRAENFVNRSAEQTDRLLTRVSQSEAILVPEDRVGLRQVVWAFKDIVHVGRETFQLGNRDDGQSRCIVNLGFLQEYRPELHKLTVPDPTTKPPLVD